MTTELGAFDQDALTAGVDLVGRSGARDIEIGYDDDDPDDVRWHAQASYRGARLIADNHADPISAVEALGRRVLAGARCRRCGKPIRLSARGKAKGTCRWRRHGDRWRPGCGKPIDTSIPHPFA